MPKRKRDGREAASKGHSWTENGESFDKGRWTKSESDKLRSAMEEFCRMKKVPLQILANRSVRRARQKGGSHSTLNRGSESSGLKDAWLDIADMSGLTKRTMMSIYNHGCRIVNQYNYKGAWTDTEVQLLRQLVSKHGKKWTKIAEELKREVRGVEQKWRKVLDADRVAASCEDNANSSSTDLKGTQHTGSNSSKGSSNDSSNGSQNKTSKAKALPRKEYVRLLIQCVRKNSNSTALWPTKGIRWRMVAKSFPGCKIASLREYWMLVLADNITFTPFEDRALLKAIAACNASVPEDVPWTRLRDNEVFRSEYGKNSSPPERPGNHYKRRFNKLEGAVWNLEKTKWKEKRTKKGKLTDGSAWAKHLKRKRGKPWDKRVKRVQEYLNLLEETSSQSATSQKDERKPRSRPSKKVVEI